MKLHLLCLAIATGAALAAAAPACAQDKTGPNVNTRAKGTPGGARTLAMAQDLFAIGLANGDALTVLTAAKLAGSVEVKAGGAIKKDT